MNVYLPSQLHNAKMVSDLMLNLLGITASGARLSVAPVVVAAALDSATRAGETKALEHGGRVEFLGVRFELRTSQSFDFLQNGERL